MNDSQPLLETGSRGAYDWLVSTVSLEDVLRLCPNVVLGKHVAVSSFDSGPLSLNAGERAIGWQVKNGLAYSPKIQSVDVQTLPREQFDEWYIFTNPVHLGELVSDGRNILECRIQVGRVHTFVNYGGFALHHPDYRNLIELFWDQLGWIQPESYIAEGDNLNFVCADAKLFRTVHHAICETL